MTKPKPNTIEVITPRGQNVGNNIKNTLINKGLWAYVNHDNINTVRDTVNKCLVTTVKYSFV